MIINASHRTAALHTGGREPLRIRCLARRGMLHSECEAVDRVSLAPHAHYDLVGRGGTEAAWYVLRGPLTARWTGAPPTTAVLGDRDLVLARTAEDLTLRAGPEGAELLCLTVTPPAVTRHLPPRTPDTTKDRT
ncbi:cupin domain-containing protein [Streptomyces griseocarneus]|uniref:cupin domain-containing protein n=1 Tax=Streptomyces griseocarneus TaxID=51201 RepID=UPI00167E359E|nr:cupin domain-containing protein [Streptomyces griseocarneus]MBZ6475141.1 hypothetical protein [Streptomyces griseocarneus]GHG62033.1 hypothetical protein GCM10018779_30390 [Streptomyces griseocarneus]